MEVEYSLETSSEFNRILERYKHLKEELNNKIYKAYGVEDKRERFEYLLNMNW